jgi:GNAT superfamily N-acetyltransferase
VSLAILPAAEISDLDARWSELSAGVWPEYNTHGDVVSAGWDGLAEDFPAFQFALVDGEELLARGHTLPFAWDGTVEGLPAGIDGLFEEAFALRRRGGEANALSAVAVAVLPAHQGRRLSERMLAYMAELARRYRLGALVAPVRPTLKERYPLTPIERYARWTREDGLPFDPWLRVHARLGAAVLQPEAHSLRITGSVAEWESWTAMRFPESGDYVFPHGLAPLTVDREADQGRYWEPNVWMRHPLA